MMERDRQLESSLVSALVQLEAHKQSLLQVVSKMREQAILNEMRQKKFVDLLLAHEQSQSTDDQEPLEGNKLFAPDLQHQPEPQLVQKRQSSFFSTAGQPPLRPV